MRERFEAKRFRDKSLALIIRASEIVDGYQAQGYDLSLRQLYYQLVARNVIPNSEKSYTNLGNLISDARMAGLIDWSAIVDRGRAPERNSHWSSPRDILATCASEFRYDLWENQPTYVEVAVEKQTLEGVLMPVCRELDMSFVANKGYSSSTALYDMSKRFGRAAKAGKEIHLLYLGDHDPSGIDMSRDVEERLTNFCARMAMA